MTKNLSFLLFMTAYSNSEKYCAKLNLEFSKGVGSENIYKFPVDVFISHSWGQDEANDSFTKYICQYLCLGNVRCFFDDFSSNDELFKEVEKGVKDSNIFLAILTVEYLAKLTAEGNNKCKIEYELARNLEKNIVWFALCDESLNQAVDLFKVSKRSIHRLELNENFGMSNLAFSIYRSRHR